MPRETALPPTGQDLADWYVPDIDDNRADPDPFRVHLRAMSATDMRRVKGEAGIGKFTKRAIVDVDAQVWALTEALFAEYVIEVSGYVGRGSDGGRVEPRTGAELIALLALASERERTAVVNDVLDALQDYSSLEAGLRGNFGSRPASS